MSSFCNIGTNLVETTANVGGLTGTYYAQIHVQGVVELSRYSGGTASGHFQTGGTQHVSDAAANVAVAELATSTQTFFLNRTSSAPSGYLVPLDYTVRIPVSGGTDLTIRLRKPGATQPFHDDGAGVPEAPQGTALPGAYGQFIQAKLVSTIVADVARSLGGQQFNKEWTTFEDNVRKPVTER